MAHENNISSIKTPRGISPKIHGIRPNKPADPRFNPTAPPFVRKASTEHYFASPGVVVEPSPSIKHDPVVGYVHELHGHSYGKPRHDPMKQHDRGREYMSHWHNPNPLSGTSSLPPPSMGAPPPSSTVSSSSRSRSSTTIQYSPQRRPYHNTVTPSPPVQVQVQVQGGDYYEAKRKLELELLSKKAEAFDNRLEYLQKLKKKLLAAFKEHSKKSVVDLNLTTTCYSDDDDDDDDLCPSWQMTELYRRDGDASNDTEKLRDEFGQGVKNVEEEIEEMWGDFKVPAEARSEEEIRFLELEG